MSRILVLWLYIYVIYVCIVLSRADWSEIGDHGMSALSC